MNCPECGAGWDDGVTCQDHFHQMLFWESERPEIGVVHHLMVLCYHLQHPGLYAPAGLEHAKTLLVKFVEEGVSPQTLRARMRDQVDSGKRQFKIKAKGDLRGAYPQPIRWTLTAAEIVAAGSDQYVASVEAWARATLTDLRQTGNLV